MSLTLDAAHLRRYKDIARVLIRHGNGDWVSRVGLEPILAEDVDGGEEVGAERAKADELAADLESLGPTFIKLGQLLSSRSDLLPAPYLDALRRLQDEVEPFPFSEVEEVVREELGVRLSKAFASFDSHPLASASLGQVHRAELRDGRQVAVKVQRPGVRARVAEDLEALADLAGLLDRHTEIGRRQRFGEVLDEFRKTMVVELDYRREADHLRAVGRNLERFDRLVVPQPVDDYTTGRVLTMDYVAGSRLDELSPVVQLEIDGGAIADQLFEAYLDQILVDGLFHADPHLGNVLITRDHRLALLDLGMVGHLTPVLQEALLKILLGAAEGQGDEVARHVLEVSFHEGGEGVERFRREVADMVMRHRRESLQRLELGRVVLELGRLGAEHGVRVPPSLMLLGKALLNLDHVGRSLAPDFDPNEAIRRHAAAVMSRRMRGSLSSGSLFSSLIDAKELAEAMPGRLNRILDTLAENRLRVDVDAIDEHKLIQGLLKIANRITIGLVCAAFIVGAALLMRVETEFTVLGYPGLALLFFLAAIVGGAALVWDIVKNDPERRR
jgi:predicted unusual protein kinase regulating ubiquinone biosynthesis (AarF/ABC1/UbiB family)